MDEDSKRLFDRRNEIVDSSKLVLGLGSAITSILMGLETMGIDELDWLYNAIILLMLCSVLLIEFMQERKGQGKAKIFDINTFTVNDIVTIVLVISSYVFAVVSLTRIPVPVAMSGAIGLLYIVLAIVMVVKVFR